MRLIHKLYFMLIATPLIANIGLAASPCEFVPRPQKLPARDGHIDFLTPEEFSTYKKFMPAVDSPLIQRTLSSPDTMWYDDKSIVYSYQDSIEFVVGLRANCVGRVLADRSVNVPGISKLALIFSEDYKFRFPFKTAAGVEDASKVEVVNFWLPPKSSDGKVLPVRWWKESNRGRWRWVFPVGTVFGEILYQRGPDERLYPFEVRSRERRIDGWKVSAFRPYLNADELSGRVKNLRPRWAQNEKLKSVIEHLEARSTLTPASLDAKEMTLSFEKVEGFLDKIPDFGDPQLVIELLTGKTFENAEGHIWKEDGSKETYAASSDADFSIVPKNYAIGMIPVNDDSCSRCHTQTGRKIADYIQDIHAYGEVWGEDQIFTWHLFEPSPNIYGPYDDSQQGSRKINPRMQSAKLLLQGKPAPNDPIYKPLGQ